MGSQPSRVIHAAVLCSLQLRCYAQHARLVLCLDVLEGVLCVCSCVLQERASVLRIAICSRALSRATPGLLRLAGSP